MPFDAPPVPTIETRIIDEMLKIFGSNGERWLQGAEDDHCGNYCLWGALKRARQRYSPAWKDDVEAQIMEAIWQGQRLRFTFIISFNDALGRTFADIYDVLQLAKTAVPTKETRKIGHEAKTCSAALISLYSFQNARKRRAPALAALTQGLSNGAGRPKWCRPAPATHP
jgi:hypothetical protein